ncbi:protein kinase domain-containing protein [Singulisphaera sp. PoT]|uniref:serine/threonine-protein kinase n=1 Tax=Singulisphaera sp. PoT TaxID=3411797 RepID=UPI003BF55020
MPADSSPTQSTDETLRGESETFGPRSPLPARTELSEGGARPDELPRTEGGVAETLADGRTRGDLPTVAMPGCWDETIADAEGPEGSARLAETEVYSSEAGGGDTGGNQTAAATSLQSGEDGPTVRVGPPGRVSSDRGGRQGDASHCGRFVLKRFHARGGMGEIWLAEDPTIGREVALKRMLGGRSEQVQRFEVEAQVTGQLEHPGIVPVHEMGYTDDGQPFYVMKFLQGRTLRKVIQDYHAEKSANGHQREVEQFRLLQIFVSLCQTVAYAHSRGVVHRDLKPDNVMQGQYGETILLDWGIAKVLGEPETASGGLSSSYVRLTESAASQETRAGTILGTPVYMAPEVATGHNEEVDHRSDVYLLGAILYEILTGQQPRSLKTAYELVHYARAVPIVPPLSVCPDVAKPLDAICRKAMALAKADRYQSAMEVAEEVQRFLAGEPVLAYPEKFPMRAWRWAKRHRKAMVRSATAALVVGVVFFAGARIRQAEIESQRLQVRESARRDVAEFRRLADEARFYAATTDSIAEHAPYFDPRRGDAAATAALGIASRWGTDWGRLPLDDLRDGLKVDSRELHALQSKLEPSQEPRTALDHFLLAEGYRKASNAAAARQAGEAGRKDWEADPARLDRAIGHYRQALTLRPDDYWSHYQLGRCYLRLGRFAEGVEALGVCIALRPGAPWGYSARGLALALQGDHGRAGLDLDQALRLDPDFRPARLNRGVSLWLRGKPDEALRDFEAVLAPPVESQLIEAAYYRGQIRLQRGEVDAALADFDRVAEANPAFAQVYRHRARIHLARGNKDLGLRDIDRYARSLGGGSEEPETWRSHASRGRTLRQMHAEMSKRMKDEPTGRELARLALDELNEAVTLGGKEAALFDDLGAMLELNGEAEKAVEAYSKGLELAADDVRLLNKRGWANQVLGRWDESLSDFHHVTRVSPENAEAHSGLGYVSALRKRPSDAQREADLALLYGGDDSKVLHNVACIYASLSEIALRQAPVYQDVAISLLKRAVDRWKQGKTPPSEFDLMAQEPAFRSLRSRPEFRAILEDAEATR